MKKHPRSYQQSTVDNVFLRLDTGTRNLLAVMATGLGKTFTAACIIDRTKVYLNRSIRTLWITHTEELIEQSALAVSKVLWPEESQELTEGNILSWAREKSSGLFSSGPELGIVKQDLFQIDNQLVVASAQTLHRRLDRIPKDHFDIVICDEAHLFMAQTFTKSVEYFEPTLRLGLTATPDRLDGISLSDLFDETVCEWDIKYGIDNGYLCELDAIRVKTTVSLEGVRKTAGELNQKDLRMLDTPARNLLIASKYLEYANGIPALAFCVDQEHAMNLCDAFKQKGIKADFVTADEDKCDDRKERIRKFKSGETDVMCNVMILTAGFDYPDTGCIIEAAPTMSRTKYMQQVGRGTRLKSPEFVAKYGQKCIVLDIADMSSRHSLINTQTLDEGKEIEDRVFLSKEKKEKLIDAREKKKRETKLQHELKQDKKVDLLKLPSAFKVHDTERTRENATQAQLDWIARLGYDIQENHYTKGQCMEIINGISATRVEMSFLESHGYDISKGATKGEFARAKKDIEEKMTNAYHNSLLTKTPFKNLR